MVSGTGTLAFHTMQLSAYGVETAMLSSRGCEEG